jgi:hypothetical protein
MIKKILKNLRWICNFAMITKRKKVRDKNFLKMNKIKEKTN